MSFAEIQALVVTVLIASACGSSGANDSPDGGVAPGDPSGLCGNGTLDPGESCDPGISSGDGACPSASECDDGNACTNDEAVPASCDASCVNAPITMAVNGDGCCPSGASSQSDDDCVALTPSCEESDVSLGSTFDAITHLSTANDHSGALWALWTEADTTSGIRASLLDPGSSAWQSDIAVGGSTFDTITALRAGNDHSGALWALWVEADTTSGVRASRLSPSSGQWESDVGIGGTTFDTVAQLRVHTDHASALWALWVEQDTTSGVRAARLDPSTGQWGSDVGVGGTTFDEVNQLQAHTDHDGALWALWVEADTTSGVRAARLDPSTGQWDSDIGIGGTTFDTVVHLRSTRDHSGALWALWVEADTTSGVRAARLDPSTGQWDSDISVGDTTFDSISHLRAAIDASGALWAVWTESDTTSQNRAAPLDPATGAWGTALRVGSSTFDAISLLEAAADQSGALWAVWSEADTTDDVRATRCGFGSP